MGIWRKIGGGGGGGSSMYCTLIKHCAKENTTITQYHYSVKLIHPLSWSILILKKTKLCYVGVSLFLIHLIQFIAEGSYGFIKCIYSMIKDPIQFTGKPGKLCSLPEISVRDAKKLSVWEDNKEKQTKNSHYHWAIHRNKTLCQTRFPRNVNSLH